MFNKLFIITTLIALRSCEVAIDQDELIGEIACYPSYYTIEGKVDPPELESGTDQGLYPVTVLSENKWHTDLSICINNGEFKGFVRTDGHFIISGVPSGCYTLHVYHPDIYYEPVSVEINSKGEIRARKVNYIDPEQAIQVPYPLKMKPLKRNEYFQTRDQLKFTDVLFSPIVLMMALPLLFLLLLPKMIDNQEEDDDV